jgi:hypothetical protein
MVRRDGDLERQYNVGSPENAVSQSTTSTLVMPRGPLSNAAERYLSPFAIAMEGMISLVHVRVTKGEQTYLIEIRNYLLGEEIAR